MRTRTLIVGAMKTQATLDHLASELATAAAIGVPDPEWVRTLLSDTLRERDWLAARFAVIPEGEPYALFPVYRDAQRRCSLLIVSLRPGVPLPVHNHGSWAVIGIYQGRERETRYARTDDASGTGRATLVRAGESISEPGSVNIVPDGEIHTVEALDGQPALSLHVYGTDIVTQERSTFDLERNSEEIFRPTFHE